MLENEIVVYQPNETVRLEARYAHESIWLTQLKIAELFGVQKAAISKHLKNIYSTGELVRETTVSKKETVVDLTCHSTVVRKFRTSVADQFRDVTKLVGSENTTTPKIWIAA